MTPEQRDMAAACIRQCLWHTDYFFKSAHERTTAIEALEAITAQPFPRDLVRPANIKGN
jgi:hypothetical protein